MAAPEFRDICIVGASLSGLRAAQALRKHGYSGGITMVGEEKHLPYDRPPLSKQVLMGSWDPSRATLADADELGQLGVRLKLGSAATGLDLGTRTVELANGESMPFDGLVIATGAKPRAMPIATPERGVLTLRNLEDSLQLREYLLRGTPRVVVVGAGFIGLEVAAGCRTVGADVTVVELLPQPLAAILGSEIGQACADWQVDHGVQLHCGVAVQAFHGDALNGVQLSDGTLLKADVAVVGIGVQPATAWLDGSGLLLDGGVVCDANCFAAPGVVAVGDVARWQHVRYGRSVRIEHWTNAAEQAAAAVTNLLAGPELAQAYVPTPYFWSDQYGKRLQFVGERDAADDLHVGPRGADGDFVAIFAGENQLKGVFGFGSPRLFMALRRLVVHQGTLDQAQAMIA